MVGEFPFRVGQGFDVHALVDGRPMIIGGVTIPHTQGLLGHSDADVLLHAVVDALLGAVALGDIGQHFSDTDPQFKDANSRVLLRAAYELVQKEGYVLGNLDATIIAQAPKMAPYIVSMREHLSQDLGVSLGQVSVKAKTCEKLGFLGRAEGIACEVVILLYRKAAA